MNSRLLASHVSPGLWLVVALFLLPCLGRAQDGGVLGDVPDASVGEGGADRDNPEGEDNAGRVVSACRSTQDCSPRFGCMAGHCRYIGVRDAERVGCLLGPEEVGGAAMAGLVLGAVRRRRRRRRDRASRGD